MDDALGIEPSAAHIPSFVPWVHLLPSLVEVLLWLEREAQAGDSAYLTASRALPGAAYLPAFAELVDALLRTIAPR